MAYTIVSPLAYFLLLVCLVSFFTLSLLRLRWALALIILALPVYLLKIEVGFIKTNVLEVLIVIAFLVSLLRMLTKKLIIARLEKMLERRLHPLVMFVISIFYVFFKFLHNKISSTSKKPPPWKSYGCYLLAAALGLLFLSLAISTIYSLERVSSLGILKGWFLIPMLYGWLVFHYSRSSSRLFLNAFAIGSIIIAGIAFVYLVGSELTYDGRLKAFYLSPNHLAMGLTAGMIVLTSRIIENAKSFFAKPVLAFSFILLTVAVLATYSYGAWLGILAGSVFVLLRKHRGKPRHRKSPTSLFLGVAATGLIVLSLILWQMPSEKFQNIVSSQRSSLQSRLMIWQAAGLIIKDHPLVGVGAGQFQEAYLSYQKYFSQPFLEWAVPQPHNLFLAFLVQLGILGLVGFLLLLGWFFAVSWQVVKKTSSPFVINTLLAIMIAILAHGLLDSTYWKNDLAVIFWAVVALAARQYQDQKLNTKNQKIHHGCRA